MSKIRRIALLIGQDISFCRDVIRGIRAYAMGKRNWILQNGPPESSVLQAFRRWKPHGIVAQLLTRNLHARRSGCASRSSTPPALFPA